MNFLRFSTMRTHNLCKFVLLIYTQLAFCAAVLVEFSKTFISSDGTITSVQNVSIGACKHQCEIRARCRSAVYHRLAHYCVLTSLARDEQPVVSEVGVVLLSGFHPTTQPDVDCDEIACSKRETCTTTQPGKKVCRLTECDKPVADHAEFLGNHYTIGSKQVDICGYRDVQITCDQSGDWRSSDELVVRDCNDLCGTSGIYTTSGLQVYCDMDTDDGHWLVFQRRQDGSENFERNWSDYMDGFGLLGGEFWLGLEPLHYILSNGEYELRIDLEDWYGVRKFAKYSSFSISDTSDNYRLSVTGYSGDAGDSLGRMNNNMFSTLDLDNDIWPGSCAITFRGAWWYSNCHDSNLNGLYDHGGETTVRATTVTWKHWHGQNYSLKRTQMKIRRK